MKLVFIRTKTDSTFFLGESQAGELDQHQLAQMKISAKAGSSSKNIIYGMQARGHFHQCEEWKFWNGPHYFIDDDGVFPVRLFPGGQDLSSAAMVAYIRENGQPDILWVEGPDYPPYIEQLFDCCPDSFKMVYSKDWRPHKIARLDRYNLCLVDEPWQVKKVKKNDPNVACGIWDKLIDYEHTHFPVATPKKYDICYIGYLRSRKNQELLIRAMAKLNRPELSCVCIGDDRKGYRATLEKLAGELGVQVHFAGEVSKEQVNLLVNQSKIGVLCARRDAVPRAILEYMAADVPVLANAELLAGTRYIGAEAGLVKSPQEFHIGLAEMLENPGTYRPRAYFLEHFSKQRTLDTFQSLLQNAGLCL